MSSVRRASAEYLRLRPSFCEPREPSPVLATNVSATVSRMCVVCLRPIEGEPEFVAEGPMCGVLRVSCRREALRLRMAAG